MTVSLPGKFEIHEITCQRINVQYQFEVNWSRNGEVNFQGSSANSVGGDRDSGQDGRTDDGDSHIIPTFSPKSTNLLDSPTNLLDSPTNLLDSPTNLLDSPTNLLDSPTNLLDSPGHPGLVMGPCIVEIDRIDIREVQYQLEVNRCRNEEVIVKGNFGWVWPMRVGRLRIDRIVMHKVQYQLEVNRCRNEEVIVKGIFGWVWPMWVGRLRVGNGAMHNDQYQFEVNWCRNEEVIVKGNFGWVWPMWVGRLRVVEIDRIVIRKFQYQFEVNQCRNEEIVKGNFGWMWAGRLMVVNGAMHTIDRIVKREVQYQFELQGSSAYSVGGHIGQDGQTDGRTGGR
ncbi:hypothetical protein DPMN_019671 [Dreissena polymorpha]|uniref:Uncharacterized protein n=1 Tax=Dreissena polymorpha TaxID=45954 RepID=A0A9D4NIV1_DREPO|nr:hypothetical protein DPMN_019671 [Dreissena polymorpha]